MALAYDIAYSNLVYSLIIGNKGFLDRCNQFIEIPDGAQAGSVTATLLDAVTATTIVDGTMLTNDTGQTAVAMTLADKAATLALKPSAAKSSLTKPANLAAIAKGNADAIVKVAQEAVIAAMVAATPALTKTLEVGQVDFVTDGTAAEMTDNLQNMTYVVTQCWSYQTDLAPGDFTIVMAPTALPYFTANRATHIQNATLGPDGMWQFMMVPIHTLQYSTSFGAAGNDAAFVFNRRNLGCKFLEVGLHGGGPIAASDGTTKWITIGSYVYGVILDDYMGVIVNPAS